MLLHFIYMHAHQEHAKVKVSLNFPQLFFCFFSNCQSNGGLVVVFIYISLMVSDVSHLFLILGFIGHLLSFIFLLRHLW